MSIGNLKMMIGAIKHRFNRIVAWTLCILGMIPLFGQGENTGRAWANVRPARADQVKSPARPNSPKPGRQRADNPQDNEAARVTRLSVIAQSLIDSRSDAVALTTEAARLCGFSIWREDRSKIADPAGAPALKLAVTDTEIREYAEMLRGGYSVALGDLIGAMDVLFKSIGGPGSCGPHLTTWLQTGVRSENASVRALTGFLQDLGAFRQGAAGGNFADDAERLDPIQALFILRVLTEDMGVPLHKALVKMKSVPSLASLDGQPLRREGTAYAEDAAAGGPLASIDPMPQESETPGWAEDAYAGGVTGLYGAVSDLMGLGKNAFGKYSTGVGKANAILSIIKFIATYTFLQGEMRVEAPGQPLIRTKNYDPGDKRTVVARFFINGARVTDWMKDHRQLVALAGLDLDMPKTGVLKGVRTEWQVDQSPFPRLQLIRTVAGALAGGLHNVRTNDNGEASVTFEGAPQETMLDPKKVMPLEKTVKITVTPQIKATEMQQDLVDAVLGAIGIKDGPVGFITPLMETLYRMNWTGESWLRLRVRDWQQAESKGHLDIEIKASGHEFRRDSALQMTIDRSLAFIDTDMHVSGGEQPEAADPEFLKRVPAEYRAQMEAGMKQMAEKAKKRHFTGRGPGIARLSINDRMSFAGGYIDACETEPTEFSDLTTWTGFQEFEFAPRHLEGARFSVDIDLEKKAATVEADLYLEAKVINDKMEKGKKTHRAYESRMRIFSGLKLQAPFDGRKGIVIPLQETPIIDGGGAMNYYGSVPIPFTFGPRGQFKGTAFFSYSVTRKAVKPK